MPLDEIRIRLVRERTLARDIEITSPEVAIKVLQEQFFADLPREALVVLNCDTANKPFNMYIASVGSINTALCPEGEILRSALLSNSASMLLIHNHPSMNLSPSIEDISITDKMMRACRLVGINFLDHVIVGPDPCKHYYSMKENNRLPLDDIVLAKKVEEIDWGIASRHIQDSDVSFREVAEEIQAFAKVYRPETLEDMNEDVYEDAVAEIQNMLAEEGEEAQEMIDMLLDYSSDFDNPQDGKDKADQILIQIERAYGTLDICVKKDSMLRR